MKLKNILQIFTLLAECSATNPTTSDIGSELLQAARDGDSKAVGLLLEKGTGDDRLAREVSCVMADALDEAAINGDPEVVKCLLTIGMKNSQWAEGPLDEVGDALWMAALRGGLKVVKCLLEAAIEDYRLAKVLSGKMWSAFQHATANGHSKVVECLLTIGMKNGWLAEGLLHRIVDELYQAALEGDLEKIRCQVEIITENRALMVGLSNRMMTGKLRRVIASPGNSEIAELLLKLPSMKVTALKIQCHVVLDSTGDDKCCICLERLTGSIFVLKCRHLFHRECINTYIKSNPAGGPRCAICRVPIDPKYPPTLNHLLRRNRGKCGNCQKDLCKGLEFRICKDMSVSMELSAFCSECVKKGVYQSPVLSCECI